MPETKQDTAMQILRDRLQAIGNDELLHDKYTLAYRDIANLINTEMLAIEQNDHKKTFDEIAVKFIDKTKPFKDGK